MICKNLLFEKAFGSSRNDDEPILSDNELHLASFTYDVAYDEIHKGQKYLGDEDNDTDIHSDISFDGKIEAAVQNFEHIVELFKRSSKAKNTFLKNFDHWSSFRKSNVQRLNEIAEEIQTNKYNSDIAKIVGGVVGAVGGVVVGLSFLTPLSAVTLPLAISGGVASALGGGVVLGTTGTEIALLKNKLEEAKTLAMQENASFSTMAQWFAHTEGLKKSLESLLDCDLLVEMSKDFEKLLDGVMDLKKLTVGEYKHRFKHVLKRCISKMCKLGNMRERFGDKVAPVVMTFVFVVCLMRDHNRVILDSLIVTQRLALGFMSTMDIVTQIGQLTARLALKGTAAAGKVAPAAVARVAVMGTLVALGIVVDVITVVLSSIEIHKRTQTKDAKKVKNAAEQLEKEFLFIESVYKEFRKSKDISIKDVAEWTTVVINHIPVQAVEENIKTAVKPLLSEEAWVCIELRRLPTSGNNWFVKVPTNHSKKLLLKSHVIVKGERCALTK